MCTPQDPIPFSEIEQVHWLSKDVDSLLLSWITKNEAIQNLPKHKLYAVLSPRTPYRNPSRVDLMFLSETTDCQGLDLHEDDVLSRYLYLLGRELVGRRGKTISKMGQDFSNRFLPSHLV